MREVLDMAATLGAVPNQEDDTSKFKWLPLWEWGVNWEVDFEDDYQNDNEDGDDIKEDRDEE